MTADTQDSPAAAVVADCRVAGGGRLGAVSFGRNGHTCNTTRRSGRAIDGSEGRAGVPQSCRETRQVSAVAVPQNRARHGVEETAGEEVSM